MTVAADAIASPRRERRSWIDWLIAAIERQPGPVWLAYVVAFFGLLAIDESLHLAVGEPIAAIQPLRFVESSFPLLLLGGLAWLNGVASRALDDLRGALALSDTQIADLRRDVTRTPAGWATLAAVVGIVQAAGSIYTAPAGYGLEASSAGLLWLGALIAGAPTTVLAFVFIAHAIHQLRVVVHVHRDLAQVDVYRLDPLYAFATLTAWTGVLLILVVMYGIVAFGVVGTLAFSPLDVATTLAFVALGVALFVVPLVGLHGRIRAEKARQRAAAGASLAAAVAEMNRRVAVGQFENSKEVTDVVTAATLAYTTISRIPTWPWRQETLRGFLGAAALPVVIWMVTAILGRVI